MAVYTVLSPAVVAAMVAVHPEVNGPLPGRELVGLEGIAQGSINTTYRLTMSDGSVWFLRVNEGKAFEVLLRERDLLGRLAQVGEQRLGAVTPRMVRSVAGSVLYAVDRDNDDARGRRWASIFPQLPGRDLGVFEVAAVHSAQVGAFVANAHIALRTWAGGSNRYGIDVVDGWLTQLQQLPETTDVAAPLALTLRDVRRHRRLLPRGTIHGDVFIDNTKWDLDNHEPRLRAVFDWEMAGRDHLMLDVAITLCAWAWQRQGEQMVFRADVAAAFIDGYQRRRRFGPSEKRGLFQELRLACIRFATSRLRDFGVARAGPQPERRVLDPLDFVQRLQWLDGQGDRAVRRALGV